MTQHFTLQQMFNLWSKRGAKLHLEKTNGFKKAVSIVKLRENFTKVEKDKEEK